MAAAATLAALASCNALLGNDDRDLEPAATPPPVRDEASSPPDAGGDGQSVSCVPACAPPSACEDGTCTPPSCLGLPRTCGSGSSCCLPAVASANHTYLRGRSLSGMDAYDAQEPNEVPEHEAYVSTFVADAFEVTVGRFRKFASAYAGPPASGSGAHPKVVGTGWDPSFEAGLPASAPFDAQMLACSPAATWTNTPGPNENKPITCVTWYEAFAFCRWDGGRLPLELEWEYIAVGERDNRLFPWGQDVPDAAFAVFGCASGACPDFVGVHPLGVGRHGELDLAGNVFEWTFDYYHPDVYKDAGGCDASDCANLSLRQSLNQHTVRGGSWKSKVYDLRGVRRQGVPPDYRADEVGFRCVR